MESVNKAGHLMSLAALQQYDPYINKLLDVTGQVALYKFNSKANEWEKTDIEGTLFVYARSASPHHGFTIMNRLSTKNLVEPINKDLEFQLQDPFLLYRNANLGIYSIWFYDKADCQRIAQLMVQIVKHETVRAQRASPDRGMTSRTNGCVEAKPIDILELLSKAKEEYHRSQSGELELLVSAEAAQSQDLVKGLGDTPDRRISAAPQEKPPHSGVKQITVEELFGSSLPKDPAPPGPNPPDVAQPEGFLRGLSYGPLPLPLEPLLSQRLTADPGGSGGERPLGPVLVPLLQAAVGPRDPPRASTSPCLVAAGVVEPLAVLCGPPGPPAPPPAYMNPLKADGPPLPMPVPGLAPSFLAGPLVTPQSFRESTPKPPPVFTGKSLASAQSKDVDTFAPPQSLVRSIPPVSMKAGLVVAGEEPSLLLSPSAFQHMVAKMTEPARNPAPPSSPPLPFGGGDQHTVLYSKTQLQDTLIHLIKNDPSFLSAIHEAYLQSLSKDLNNMKL